MARFDKGWLKLWRMDDDHWLWKDNMARSLWYDLLLMANYKPSRLRTGKAIRELSAGVVVTSLAELAERVGASTKVIRLRLEAYQNDHMIVTERSRNGTIITICNWDKYQSNDDEQGHEEGTKRANEGHDEGTIGARSGHVSEETKKLRIKEFNSPFVPGNESGNGLMGMDDKKISFAEDEIPESNPYVSVSIPPESRNTPSNSIQDTGTTSDIATDAKSNSVEVDPIKNDLPQAHSRNQKTPSPNDLAQIWNDNRGTLPKVLKVTGDREKKARVRLREEPDLDNWKDAITKLSKWEWGTGHNDSGWMADFDYLLRPGTMVKAAEGFFDPKTPLKKEDASRSELIDRITKKYAKC